MTGSRSWWPLVLGFVIATLVALVPPPRARAGACAPPWIHPVVMTTRFSARGGVVVGLAANSARPSLFSGTTRTPFESLTLDARDEATDLAAPTFVREELAPGLVRFVPERALSGTLSIHTEATPRPITVGTTARARRLAAPRVLRVQSVRGFIDARLARAIPRGVIAVIVYGYDASGASQAIAWSDLENTRGREIVLPAVGGRCDPAPPGFSSILGRTPDPRIELAWVGEGGDLSPRSAPVTPELAADL